LNVVSMVFFLDDDFSFVFVLLKIFSIPFINASGLNEILSIPSFIKNVTNSGMSLGAYPHNPTFIS
jgi:hypothetical protein